VHHVIRLWDTTNASARWALLAPLAVCIRRRSAPFAFNSSSPPSQLIAASVANPGFFDSRGNDLYAPLKSKLEEDLRP
jgi:hypothetical protein